MKERGRKGREKEEKGERRGRKGRGGEIEMGRAVCCNSRVLAVSQHVIAATKGSRGIGENPISRHIWKQIYL